jgi:hypothetical protein
MAMNGHAALIENQEGVLRRGNCQIMAESEDRASLWLEGDI